MIERVVENWLDNATELSFQGPFCAMLSANGHTVVHLSRHCGMELGKDVLTIAPDGVPCAYQLKTAQGGKISLRQWRDEVGKQAFDLVVGRIVHPSINPESPHRAYLVTNGQIEEEVARAIDDMNRNWELSGQAHLKLDTVVRGQLLDMGKALNTSLWPSELTAVQKLLQLFLTPGEELFPRAVFADLMEQTLPFDQTSPERAPSSAAYRRAIASSALICALSASRFSRSQNHVAEVDAWVIYTSYIFALATKYDLDESIWKPFVDVALTYVFNRLVDLCDEIKTRTHLLEGNLFGDQIFIPARRTWLAGLLGVLGLAKRLKSDIEIPNETEIFLHIFCQMSPSQVVLWGEAAVPQLMALYWYLRANEGGREPDDFLFGLIKALTQANRRGGIHPIPDPYYRIDEVLESVYGLGEKPIEDDFSGRSHCLEGLLHVYVRRNWKQHVKWLWPDVTHVGFESYTPGEPWLFFLWRDRLRSAKVRLIQPHLTQDWGLLCTAAAESGGATIPERAKKYPIFVLLLLIVMPHRATADVLRWVDSEMVR